MKNILKQFSQFLGMPIVLLAATANYSHGAVADTNAVPEEATARKSVFEDDLKNGKDPFFPKSVRRAAKIPTVNEKAVAPIVQLALKGISGSENRRFALINNQPLAAGETAYVRIATGQVKVHCLEIRENSVIISIEGDPKEKELRLREGL
jgi:hypothetical protein